VKGFNSIQKKAIIALVLFNIVIMLAGITGTVLAYIGHSFNPDPEHPVVGGTMLTQLMSAGNFTAFFMGLAIGPLAARYSKKILLSIGICLMIVQFALFLFVGYTKAYTSGGFWILIVAVLIGGIAQGIVATTSASTFGDFLGPEKSPQWISIAQALGNGGAMLANILAGYLAVGNGGEDWPKVYWIGALLIPVLVIFVFLLPGKSTAEDERSKWLAADGLAGPGGPGGDVDIPVPWKRVIPVGALTALACIFYVGMMFNISVYIVDAYKLGTSVQVGYVNTVLTLVGLVVGLTYAVWSKIFKHHMVKWTYTIQATGILCLWLIHGNLIGAFLCAVLMGFGFAIQMPWVFGFLMALAPGKNAPKAMAAVNIGASVGLVAAPFINNPIATAISGGAMYGTPEHMFALLGYCTIGFFCCVAATFWVFNVKGTPLDPKFKKAQAEGPDQTLAA
jgi:MFS family permease